MLKEMISEGRQREIFDFVVEELDGKPFSLQMAIDAYAKSFVAYMRKGAIISNNILFSSIGFSSHRKVMPDFLENACKLDKEIVESCATENNFKSAIFEQLHSELWKQIGFINSDFDYEKYSENLKDNDFVDKYKQLAIRLQEIIA